MENNFGKFRTALYKRIFLLMAIPTEGPFCHGGSHMILQSVAYIIY